MTRYGIHTLALAAVVLTAAPRAATQMKVDLGKETGGKPPTTFEPIVGTWIIGTDAGEKVIMLDGRPWVASKDNPTRLLVGSARRLYGTSNEELMDNAKQFAYYPVALLNGVESFSNGSISVTFKTVGGEADRCSGLLFNVKPNGDWLAFRYNDTEHNVAFWEFHNGVRRSIARGREGAVLAAPGDLEKYHELRLDIDGANLTGYVDGAEVLRYVLGSAPRPRRDGTPPNPDLFPANNPVLRPPVSGRIGLWSKTDSSSYFKDYVVAPKQAGK